MSFVGRLYCRGHMTRFVVQRWAEKGELKILKTIIRYSPSFTVECLSGGWSPHALYQYGTASLESNPGVCPVRRRNSGAKEASYNRAAF